MAAEDMNHKETTLGIDGIAGAAIGVDFLCKLQIYQPEILLNLQKNNLAKKSGDGFYITQQDGGEYGSVPNVEIRVQLS